MLKFVWNFVDNTLIKFVTLFVAFNIFNLFLFLLFIYTVSFIIYLCMIINNVVLCDGMQILALSKLQKAN